MKIVLGVCGFGLGHSSRQRPVLEGLLRRGHEVILVTHDQSHAFFAANFPQVINAEVDVPVMHTRANGLDFDATARDPRNANPSAGPAFWDACGLVERSFGRPDLVISDYDMTSAQIAYLFGAPLVTLDQQSKFLGYAVPEIDGYTPAEHRMRLGFFFPKARARIATSFFRVGYAPVAEYPVTVIPPILGSDIAMYGPAPEPGHVTVYLSAAGRLRQPVEEIIDVLGRFPDHRFACFFDHESPDLPTNVAVNPFQRAAFVDSLRRSSAVISTAGHNLITEAVYLRVPMFLLPFDHYEQRLNAAIVTAAGVGTAAARLTRDGLSGFLDAAPGYRQQFRDSPWLYDRFDGDVVFLDLVESLLAGG